MQDDPMSDPRFAAAPFRLRQWFLRVEDRGFDEPLHRELELDRLDLTTRLLDYLRGAHGWPEDQVVPRDEAWTAIERFDASDLSERARIDRRFVSYPESGPMRHAVRDLALRALTHEI